jgi:hypothetical protein
MDQVNLELQVTGKVSEPTRKMAEALLQSQRQLEAQLYGSDITDDLGNKRIDLGDEQARGRIEAMREGSEGRIGAQKDIAANRLAFDKERADLDRQQRAKLEADKLAAKKAIEGQKLKAGAGAKAEKMPSEGQSSSASYVARMEQAMPQIQMFYKTRGFDATSPKELLTEIPSGELLYKVVKNPDAQRYYNAARAFINSTLRKESGASISPEEFKSARAQYFPGPGDTPEVIEQKFENMRVAIAGMRAAAGSKATALAEQEIGSMGAADPKILQFAKQFTRGDYQAAKILLEKRGYRPNETKNFGPK